ncbi:hypothetical protein KY329_05160 [Candidatus Woesearchaeota archaeon]|nr:hypothetical protein [Candidatus Woesearchaeota archaeon]
MKRGQQLTVTTITVFVLAAIVIAVVVILFVQQTTKSGKRFSNLTEESSVDITKCRNMFLGRKCYDSCPKDFEIVPGAFTDCPSPRQCCAPS